MPKKDLNTKEKISPVGIGMSGEVFKLYCPACGHEMLDLIFFDEKTNFEYPEKQCPICLTIYQLASSSKEGAHSAQEVILAPRSKEWLKKFGKKYIRGALPGSW